jgi:uncharacterized protein (TIGR03067 family)
VTRIAKVTSVLALLLLVGCSPKGKPSAIDTGKELEKFQGSWRAFKATKDGKEAPNPNRIAFTFKGDKVSSEEYTSKIILDATKTPAEIDIVDTNGAVSRGIYRFHDNEALEMCLEAKGDRPKEFASPIGSTAIVFLLKRERVPPPAVPKERK